MLTARRWRLQWMLGIVAALATVLTVLPVVTGVTVSAADAIPPGCERVEVVDGEGDLNYKVVCPPDEDGGGSGDDGGGPSCELHGEYDEFCYGEAACWGNNPAATQNPVALTEPRPSPDAQVAYRFCVYPDGTLVPGPGWYWTTDGVPSLEEQAQAAYGALEMPAFTLAFNPPQRTYVSLDTWWWVEGPTDREITGTSAFTVVAIGTPDHIQVDPGDGSGVISCEWTTSESSECVHVYQRASVDGSAEGPDGSPAYAARARLVYSVHFENAGEPLNIPGLPDELTSPWEATAVPVAEVQTLITDDD